MQVSSPHSLFAKRTSNYLLVQLPSPRCLFSLVDECVAVVRFLLLLSGDIEQNPGPDSAAVLAELKKLSSGQSKLLSEVQDLKCQLLATNATLSELSKRLTNVEANCQQIEPLRQQLGTVQTDTAETASRVCNLETRLDEAENRSRRNNLIFYGISDTNKSESFAQSEELVIRLCSEQLNFSLEPKEIERAHRLGRYCTGRNRPIIVKLSFFKTKEAILSNGRRFKNTPYSVGEDFSKKVQNARKHLVAFAKNKAVPFSLHYKTLLIGSKRYTFDETSQSVKES
ncbi:uncharacterized protein LOC119382768 [Rhipicephalus sanguineus]|uniref:uncharacterized protein LOC119382768 n=1 Tax=Rhipicephalus sanguineus TaxID=34632 RepID=UPI00189580D8|nr:uncharacterized protein LOC119382768 [Rhipicephalus sanguineus]